MSRAQAERKAIQRRPERHKKVMAKRAASQVATVQELAAALGIGMNMAYELLQKDKLPGVLRIRRRYLIPRVVIARLVNGEIGPITIP